MDKKLTKAFNEQIKNELASSYLYLSMAAYFESINLGGCGHWMQMQAKEELMHAMKLYAFLNDVGEKVELEAIAKPPVSFASPLDTFKHTLAHEKKVTSMINKLYTLAQKTGDHAATICLQWFVTEQVEEEKSAAAIIEMLKMIKADSGQMIMIDRELANRAQPQSV